MMMMPLARTLLLVLLIAPACSAELSFSAGFSSDAVLQRSEGSEGARVYGFTDSAAAVTVSVTGSDGAGKAVKYDVPASVSAEVEDAISSGTLASSIASIADESNVTSLSRER